MASRAAPRQKRSVTAAKVVNSPSSSITSSSRLVSEVASVDGQSSPASSSSKSKPHSYLESLALETEVSKENVTVTVRFRPLSPREIRQGEEIAWYADGDTIVRSENNPSVAYAYDRVFGPTTTTRLVYDVAAQHIVSGAMEGINGTIFAYGVTSSGKTHTMHGDQRSPGIIPLAVKDAFSIIQETPNREFLLRVSYLEIYNEVVNDLLNPAGQNLRIREDLQGTFIEGIKEEVVLSPAHALSLIAAGEEHRHVGSTNFNLLSSRSHTIFTLTIESTPCGDYSEDEAVNLSQLHLIDLAGSESSRVETTGLRRKEGAYINKSLLTLGTVISKLTEGRASHIPYRDSKLTRLLQSSLSGQGRVSLICTVTPSSSNAEETHNTLKFAHRAKRIEILASQNKIIDEKSLIKKYQVEIRCLKEELEQLKKGMLSVNVLKDNGGDDIVLLKQKLEDGHVKMQSRLEQEEEAKAALLGRIQRLTKLILVSTKTTHSPRFHQRPVPRRRHSFGEEELSYLPFRRRDMILDQENSDFFGSLEGYGETDYSSKEEKKGRKPGLLNWFKLRRRDTALTSSDGDKSSGTKSLTTPSTPQADCANLPSEPRISNSILSECSPVNALAEASLNGDLASENVSLQETPLASTSTNTIDHVDLMREQLKILAGEVALSSSVLKRLSDEAANNPRKEQIRVEIRKVTDEIKAKNQHMFALEKRIADLLSDNKNNHRKLDLSPSYAALVEQLNEKTFELEVKTADNRVIQDQLQQKICECEELQETLTSLRQQLSEALDKRSSSSSNPAEYSINVMSLHELRRRKESLPLRESNSELQQPHLEHEIEDLKGKISELTEAKSRLEAQNQKLAEESQYAKGLASAAGVELKALSEEVTKLMNRNEGLANELSLLKNSSNRRATNGMKVTRGNGHIKRHEPTSRRDSNSSHERELALEAALMEKEQRETELQKKMEELKQKEAFLENDLANMWILVAKLKKSQGSRTDALEDDK
ncbi:kinesin-like protein KIN-7D, chloroplastic [Phalaenopsis equestris]|uniref:kinesin-like protein KIN-7D, chloroplastic n=1 Tax=Phalaenopsis equestris TaxID=78828 RepID=UPI0009E2849C|nr:kinesin-like protein KIN-7D, chloroplastic [Phalaenopsis equestris]